MPLGYTVNNALPAGDSVTDPQKMLSKGSGGDK